MKESQLQKDHGDKRKPWLCSLYLTTTIVPYMLCFLSLRGFFGNFCFKVAWPVRRNMLTCLSHFLLKKHLASWKTYSFKSSKVECPKRIWTSITYHARVNFCRHVEWSMAKLILLKSLTFQARSNKLTGWPHRHRHRGQLFYRRMVREKQDRREKSPKIRWKETGWIVDSLYGLPGARIFW